MIALIVLFIAAMWAGVQNALAGGGAFITLPSLMLTGMDARAANIPSTVALFPAQLVTGFTGRADAASPTGLTMRRLFIISLIGGGLGALILLATPPSIFARLVPWLVLFATALFAWGSFFRKTPAARRSAFVASRRERGAVFHCGLRRLFRRRHRPLDDGRADHDGLGGAQFGRGEEHSRWRDQRLRGCDLRLFQGHALDAGGHHRDRRLFRRLGRRIDAATRQRETFAAGRRRPWRCAHDRAVLDRALGLRMRERSNET